MNRKSRQSPPKLLGAGLLLQIYYKSKHFVVHDNQLMQIKVDPNKRGKRVRANLVSSKIHRNTTMIRFPSQSGSGSKGIGKLLHKRLNIYVFIYLGNYGYDGYG